jgi:hypothetical protein
LNEKSLSYDKVFSLVHLLKNKRSRDKKLNVEYYMEKDKFENNFAKFVTSVDLFLEANKNKVEILKKYLGVEDLENKYYLTNNDSVIVYEVYKKEKIIRYKEYSLINSWRVITTSGKEEIDNIFYDFMKPAFMKHFPEYFI